MIAMIRAMAKLCIVVAAIAAFLPTTPSYAAVTVAYASSSGQDNASCSGTAPCQTINSAWAALVNSGSLTGLLECSNGPVGGSMGDGRDNVITEFYCAGGSMVNYEVGGANSTLRIHHLRFQSGIFNNASSTGIRVTGSGTVILDDCDFADYSSAAIDIEPNGPLNLVIKNSRISNSASGMLLKPAAGGSINATLDHVTITGNGGGGIKADSTNGVIDLDISDSVISKNGGNGINAVGGANQNIVSIKNSIIAKNAVAGVQANGATAGVLLATTLLDQNTTGALSVVNGGNIFTYGNNQVVGTQGSNFTSTAALK